MKQRLLLSTFLSMAIAIPALAAQVPDGTKLDPAFVRGLMNWVEQKTGVRAPNHPAVIASREKFALVMKMNGVRYADARAIYIPGMVILDNEAWAADEPKQVSLLLHELVHHVQLFAKRKYPCAEAKEYEAYTLQNQWLEEQGEAPFASQSWIDAMSHCDRGGPVG